MSCLYSRIVDLVEKAWDAELYNVVERGFPLRAMALDAIENARDLPATIRPTI